ncbi:MAG TPA: hypothetical protein PL009_08230 [Flavipsychrobacter sp.]|nr:hypothetical protein [Flavipsychrobacter sp.]
MRLLYLLLILCSNPLFTSAKNTDDFDFRKTQSIQAKLPFSQVRVIDKRSFKEDLGHIRTGGFNRMVRLRTQEDFNILLERYCNSLPEQKPHNDDTLLLVLHDFMIEDRPNGDELGTFYFRARFYIGSNNRYLFIREIDSIYEIRDAWDVTKRIRQIPSEKIYDYLNALTDIEKPIANPISVQEAVNSNDAQKEKFPIYQVSSFKKGIYSTINDFLANRPLDTPFIKTVYNAGDVKQIFFHYQNEKEKRGKSINNVFALFDGEHWYHPSENRWLRMRYEHGEFYQYQYFEGKRNQAGDVIAASVFFGAVGGAIAGSGNSNSSKCLYKARLQPASQEFKPVKRVN